MGDLKDKLKNVWTQYKASSEQNKKDALEFHKKHIEGKSFIERVKISHKAFKLKKW